MCATCGCSDGSNATIVFEHPRVDGHDHEHDHPNGHDHEHDPSHSHDDEHDHPHGHDHEHDHPRSHGPHAAEHRHGDGGAEHIHATADGRTVALEVAVLAKNDALAAANRRWFADRNIVTLNFVSSPGSGKTTLLERTIRELGAEVPFMVVEGDQATQNDSDRIRAAGAPALQVNTGTGCHLEADMIARAMKVLEPPANSVVIIENVGNLVCPALFDLGERAKIAVISVTEGDDKPAKYPHMFLASEVLIINKIDLLPYVDFNVERCIAHARNLRPDLHAIVLSAKTGENIEAWYDWLRRSRKAVVPGAAVGVASRNS